MRTILVIDEALAVGDIFFQAKCMLRLDALRDAGTTIIFVSHDTGTVRALCQRCLLLDRGRMQMLANAAIVMDTYVGKIYVEANGEVGDALPTSPVAEPAGVSLENLDHGLAGDDVAVSLARESDLAPTTKRYGAGGARILDVKLLDGESRPTEEIEVGAPFRIQASVRYDRDMPAVVVGYSIRDLKGQMVVGGLCSNEDVTLPPSVAGDVCVYEVSGVNRLQPGVYTVSFGVEIPVLLNRQHVFVDVLEHCAVFRSRQSANASWASSIRWSMCRRISFARMRPARAVDGEVADVAAR